MNRTEDNLLICQGCLAIDGKFFDIRTPPLLSEYSILIGSEVYQYDGTPQYLCHICSALLLKFAKFRDKCLHSKRLFESIQTSYNGIALQHIKKLNIHSTPYQQIKVQTHEYQPEKADTEIILDNTDNAKPATDIDNEDVKIKTNNETIDIQIKIEDANSQNESDVDFSANNHTYLSNQNETNTQKIKYNYESDPSDDNALVVYKSSHKKKRKKIKINTNKLIESHDLCNDKSEIATVEQNLNNNSKPAKEKHKINNYESETAIVKHKLNNIESEIAIDKLNNTEPGTAIVKHKLNNDESVNEISRKKNRFESNENLDDFGKLYNVDVIVLSKEEQFSDVLDRKMSINYLHSPYRCESCYKGFMDEDNLTKHFMSQHDLSRGSVVCEFCKFRYKDKRGLNQHLKKHRLKFACRQCKFVSRTTFNAKEHYKMHSGRLHRCKQCGKCYEKLSSHLSHMRIHHPSDLVWCEYCGEPFIGEFGLNGHKKRAHRDLIFAPEAVCYRCDINFLNLEALAKHANRHKEGAGEIPCVLCGLGFQARLDLKDHLLEEHRAKKKYKCEKCSKTFSKESLYSAHYRRMHVDTVERSDKMSKWICEVCGKSLPSKCLLVYHQRNHTGERPYQCAECPKSFTMRKLLHSHMRVHTNERPYSCKACPKTFKGLSALRSHENIHAGVKSKMALSLQL